MLYESSLYMELYYEGSQQASIPSTVRKIHKKVFFSLGAKVFSIVQPQSLELTGFTGKMALTHCRMNCFSVEVTFSLYMN